MIYGASIQKDGTYKFSNGDTASIAEIASRAKASGIVKADDMIVIDDSWISDPKGQAGQAIAYAAKQTGVNIVIPAVKDMNDPQYGHFVRRIGVYIFRPDGRVDHEPKGEITADRTGLNPNGTEIRMDDMDRGYYGERYNRRFVITP